MFARTGGSAGQSIKTEDAEALLQRVAKFYARTLHKDEAGISYFNQRNPSGATLLEVFRGLRQQGAAQIGDIIRKSQTLGVLNAKGQGIFWLRHRSDLRCSRESGWHLCAYRRRAIALVFARPASRRVDNAAARTNQTLFITEAILDGAFVVRVAETVSR